MSFGAQKDLSTVFSGGLFGLWNDCLAIFSPSFERSFCNPQCHIVCSTAVHRPNPLAAAPERGMPRGRALLSHTARRSRQNPRHQLESLNMLLDARGPFSSRFSWIGAEVQLLRRKPWIAPYPAMKSEVQLLRRPAHGPGPPRSCRSSHSNRGYASAICACPKDP